MELAFPLPQTNADLMTYGVGAFTALFGLVALFAPVTMLRALRLTTHSAHPEAGRSCARRSAASILASG